MCYTNEFGGKTMLTLFRKKIVSSKENELLDGIKKDLFTSLGQKGIGVQAVDMKICSKNISLSILLKSSRRYR